MTHLLAELEYVIYSALVVAFLFLFEVKVKTLSHISAFCFIEHCCNHVAWQNKPKTEAPLKIRGPPYAQYAGIPETEAKLGFSKMATVFKITTQLLDGSCFLNISLKGTLFRNEVSFPSQQNEFLSSELAERFLPAE